MAKRGKQGSSGTPAIVALEQAGVEFALHAYDHDPAGTLGYGLEAATAIGVDPQRVFKTLVARVDQELVVAVVPVDGSLDLKALARAVAGKRAAMAEPAAAQRATGYVAGGISPLGQRQRLRTVVDTSAQSHPSIYVSAGRRGLDVELPPGALVDMLDARVAPIARRG
jgi:Cys-tRNA(Pro)/Cys-tRNA(Cys) deacylase